MFDAIGLSPRVLVCVLAFAPVAVIVKPIDAQERQDRADRPNVVEKRDSPGKPDFARYQARPDGSMPMIHDWSNRHVIYTASYTAEQADRMARDPRAHAAFLAHGMAPRHGQPIKPVRPFRQQPALHRDWAVSLGAASLATTMYPAKYTFDVDAPPNCTSDFVVYPVSPAYTGSTRASIIGTFTGDPQIGQTASITITPTGSGPVTLTLTAGTTNTGTTFAVSGTNNASTDAANLATAVNRNLSSAALDEMAAVALANTVTVYALTAGTGVTLNAAATLGSFNWGSATAGTNGTQANIVGLNNLYAGSGSPFCAGYTFPTFTFSYSAGVAGVYTSPVLSLDGRKIAFIEHELNIGSILHILTLGTGSEYGSCTNNGAAAPTCATAAVIPGSTPGSNATDYMLPLQLAGGLAPYTGISSPFVDYANDILYVGDDRGDLFSVSPIFGGGSPAIRSGFPVALPGGVELYSPVVDGGNTGNIFITGSATLAELFELTSDGTLQEVIPLGLASSASGDGPVLDSTNKVGYAVTDCANSTSTGVLVQFSTASVGMPVLATVDLGSNSCHHYPVFNATTDNNYFTKGISSSTPSDNGELLVAYYGPLGGSLAQFQFTSGVLNATPEYVNTYNGGFNNNKTFSPLTEFYGNDQAYPLGGISQSGNTVTVSTTANAFVSNQVVVISGVQAGTGGCTTAAANSIDGEQTVTVTSPTSFAFTSAANATIGGAHGICNLTGALATGPTQDYLFFASTYSSSEMFAFDLPLTSATQLPASTNSTSISFGTGGIIVDNDSSDDQASSIYFETSGTTLGCGTTSSCAVKLTQSGLN